MDPEALRDHLADMARDEILQAPGADPGSAGPVPDTRGTDLFLADGDLELLVRLHCGEALAEQLLAELRRLGRLAGGPLDELAAVADRNPPVLAHRDRRGEDVQRVEKHPAHREMERIAFAELGLAALSHRAALGRGEAAPPIEKHLLTYLFAQAEFGLLCPVSMTDSLARTLRRFGGRALVERFLPGLASQDMDTLLQGAMSRSTPCAIGGGSREVAGMPMRWRGDGRPRPGRPPRGGVRDAIASRERTPTGLALHGAPDADQPEVITLTPRLGNRAPGFGRGQRDVVRTPACRLARTPRPPRPRPPSAPPWPRAAG